MITRSIASLLLLATPLLADTIHRNDGQTITDVTISEESLTEVTYKEGRKSTTISASEVRSIVYDAMPSLVEEGLSYLGQGDPSSAQSAFEEYLRENIPKVTERRYEWAPAFAAFQTISIYQQLGDFEAVVEAAERMILNFGKSRYLPEAYVMKAKALSNAGQADAAKKTLDALAALVSSNNLSKRWDLECRLARVRADASSKGENRRSTLSAIQQEAGNTFPSVKSRALVAEGESYLLEAERSSDATKSKRLRDSGQRIFEDIVKDKNSDELALAGAHTGLGDCLFFTGAASDDKDVLKLATLNYLRVITLYQADSEYVAKSLFFAMRCFELMGDRGRVRDMKRDLLRLYGESAWAKRQEVTRAR